MKAILWLTLAALLAAVLPPARAQELTAPENNVKAAFLYNFTKLVEWPAGTFARTNSPIVIGVLGRDPFGAALDRIVDGKHISGRPVNIVRFNRRPEPNDCHVLFISDSERTRVGEILAPFGKLPVLTVSDLDDFAKHGGIIGLVKRDERLQFEVNTNVARKAGLVLSSQLLRLARIVNANKPNANKPVTPRL